MLTEWRRRMLACITYRGWNGDITPWKLYRWQRPRYSYQARTFSSRRQPYMSRLLTGHLYAAFSSHARIVSCRKVRRTIPRLHFKLCTLKSRYQLACTSCTLFRPRTSPKGSVNWDDGGRVFPDEYYFTCLLYESLFTLFTSHVSMYHVPWLKWRHNTFKTVQMAKTSVQLSSQNIFVTPTTVYNALTVKSAHSHFVGSRVYVSLALTLFYKGKLLLSKIV